VRYGWLLIALAAVAVVGLVAGPEAFGNTAGPALTLDQGFNSGQPVAPQFAPDGPGGSPGGTLFASAIQPDGKVIVVGQNPAGNPPIVKFDVARYNTDGTLDTSFGTGGYVQVAPTANSFNFADAVALDPQTGDIVIAGGDIGGQDVPELVRLTPSGAADTSFGGGSGWVVDNADAGSFLTGVMVDSSSRIVTIGSDGVARRYAADGSADLMFGAGGHTGVLISTSGGFGFGTNALALQPADGKILVAGTSSSAGGTVIRLNTDGSFDSTFGSGGTATLAPGSAIRQLTLQGTAIVVGGSDASGNGMVARLTSNGALDTSFGGGSGYDIFTPPSGSTAHVDALFYDPNPGLIVCLYYSGSSVCFSTDVNGVPTGSSVTPPGQAKDGGAIFSSGVFTVLGYAGVTVYTAADTSGGSTGTGSGGGTGGGTNTTTGCPPIALTFTGENVHFLVGKPFTAFVRAQGGTPPYRYALTVNPNIDISPSYLPLGVTFGADGSLHGSSHTQGAFGVSWILDVTVTDSLGCQARGRFFFYTDYPPTPVTTGVVPKGGPKPPVHPLSDEVKAALRSQQNWAFAKTLAWGAVIPVAAAGAVGSVESGVGEVVFIGVGNVAATQAAAGEAEYLLTLEQLADDPPDKHTHELLLPPWPGKAAVRDPCRRVRASASRQCREALAALRALTDVERIEIAAARAIVTAQNRFGSAAATGDGVGMDLQYAAIKTDLGIESDALAAAQKDVARLSAVLRPAGLARLILPVAALRKAGNKNATRPARFLPLLLAAPPIRGLRSQYLRMNGFDLAYLVEALAAQDELSKGKANVLEKDAKAIRHARRGHALRQAIARFLADTSPGSLAATTPAGFLQTAARGIR
jgi:uncharacterized delta-60 repeat protein